MRASVIAALSLLGAAHAEVIDPSASYPEGALWRDGKLFYTEMGADQVAHISGGPKRVFWRERGCGPTSLASYGAGLLVLCHRGGELVALDAQGAARKRWRRER